MSKTLLYDRHVALGAKMTSFAGWEMPVFYSGIIKEHFTVRQGVGLFDISHMGMVKVEGEEAERFLNFLSTNQIAGKPNGAAIYTGWCQEDGGCVDDVMIYKRNPTSFFVIVNASNRQQDLDHMRQYGSAYQVEIQDCYADQGILALQGPLAETLLATLIPEVKILKPMRFLEVKEPSLIISRTGYTGAGGFELYAHQAIIAEWWDRLLQAGAAFGIAPVGLGARDTLRLEMGYALYGHEISSTITPIESVAAWTVKLDKAHFLGKQALEELEKKGTKRHAYGMRLMDPGIAREGSLIFKNGQQIGRVTSGSFSPTLNQAIALIVVETPLEIGEEIEVEIRQHRNRAQIVPIPFIRKTL